MPTFSGGTGEPDDPYLISAADELNSIGHNPRLMNAHFKLINDVDLTGVEFFIIGNELFPFAGVFNGNDHTISNFSYTSTDRNYVGLFGYVGKWGKDAVITDLGLITPNGDAGTGDFIGSLVGKLYYFGTITNCYVEGGSASGAWWVGGLVGKNRDFGTIANCDATGSVSGRARVGGLVGENCCTITNCYATGNVTGSGTMFWEGSVGGLVGDNYRGTITNCNAT